MPLDDGDLWLPLRIGFIHKAFGCVMRIMGIRRLFGSTWFVSVVWIHTVVATVMRKYGNALYR